MEWRPAGRSACLPLLIFPCTIKSRGSLLAPAHPGGPRKRAVKRLWWCDGGVRWSHQHFLFTADNVSVNFCLQRSPAASTLQELIRRWDSELNFYAVSPEGTWIRWKKRKITAITPFKVTDFGTNQKIIYDFLLVINTNLPPILHRFRDIAVDRIKIAIFCYPLCLTPPAEGFPFDDLHKIFRGCQRMAKVPNAVEILPKIWTAWVGRTNVTDRQTNDKQTDGRQHIANVNPPLLQ